MASVSMLRVVLRMYISKILSCVFREYAQVRKYVLKDITISRFSRRLFHTRISYETELKTIQCQGRF